MSLTLTTTSFSGGVTEYVNPTIRGVGNYLYWLCGKFGIEGQFIITGAGGGTVLPITPGSTPNPLEFVITLNAVNGSVMIEGESTLVLNGTTEYPIGSGIKPNYIGYNLVFFRNNIPQSTINTGASYYTWNKTTGTFTCSPAAVEGELFQLYPTI